MQKLLILLSGAQTLGMTQDGQAILRDFQVSYQLRFCSAQLAPDELKALVKGFQKEGGRIVLCLAPAGDNLGPLVTTHCELPVLQVLVGDAPAQIEAHSGILPWACLGMNAAGFTQAAMFAIQILALEDKALALDLQRHRHSLAAQIFTADQEQRVIFDG